MLESTIEIVSPSTFERLIKMGDFNFLTIQYAETKLSDRQCYSNNVRKIDLRKYKEKFIF